MQENAIHTRHSQYDGIGSGTLLIRDQISCSVSFQNSFNNIAESVFSHLAQQGYVIPQQFERKTGIGDTAARMDAGGIHTDQFTRDQQIGDAVIAVSGWKDRGNIQTDVSG